MPAMSAEQHCLKWVGFQLRSLYCTYHMWMTVNSPLTCKILRWSPNILVIQSFGPPTELWVACTSMMIEPSFHFKLPLSMDEQWPNRLVGEGEFPGQVFRWCFLNNRELTVFFHYDCVEDVSKGSIVQWSHSLLVCKNFTNTSVYWNTYH